MVYVRTVAAEVINVGVVRQHLRYCSDWALGRESELLCTSELYYLLRLH